MSALGHRRPHDVDGVDRAIARLATRQSGVVARDQLVRLGVRPDAIDHRLKSGRLIALHRGVYAVGHEALADRGRVIGALLAAGPSAVASHRTAAALLELIPSMPVVVEVTVTGRARRSRHDLVIHETTRPPGLTQRQGISLTAPLRTLQDLKATRPSHEFERACTEALVARLVTQAEVDGVARIGTELAPSRSELERTLLALISQAGLPTPRVNHAVGPRLVDFLWPDHGLIVETDGYAAHGHRGAFERDRGRDAGLQAAGYAVLRFTWRQLTREPLRVAAGIAQVLSRRSSARDRTRA